MTHTVRRSTAVALALVMAAAAVLLAPSAEAAKKKPKFKVSAKLSASTVKTSHSFTISGKVTKPKAPKKRVIVQKRVGTKWVAVAKPKLTKKSKYKARVNAGSTPGTFTYRVLKKKTKQTRKAVSKRLTVKVVTWGTVKAWGTDLDGQLGDGGDMTSRQTPGDVAGLTEVVEVSTNNAGASAFARRLDGTVWAWGLNASGELGIGSDEDRIGVPTRIPDLTGVRSVAAGAVSAAAVKSDGTVVAWGANNNGQLGNGVIGGANTNRPTAVTGLTGVTALTANGTAMYALKTDGTVWAWGGGQYGNLGQGTNVDSSAVPIQVKGLPAGITQLAAIGDTTFALAPNGTVHTWGYDSDGQRGDGTTGAADGNVTQVKLAGVKRVFAGPFDTAFAVLGDGSLWSWGVGFAGQLGNGSTANASNPVRVSGITDPRDVSGSTGTSLAATKDGAVWSWGDAAVRGVDTTEAVSAPVQIPGLGGATSVAGSRANGYAVIG